MNDEIDILARTCWGEERSLGHDAMQCVANVVLNRVKAQKWWGLTIIEVCKKPEQFDCWNSDDPNCEALTNVTMDDPQFAIAMQIATDAINDVLPDITNGAVAYYNTTMLLPYWARGHTPCFTIGNMVLYNDID